MKREHPLGHSLGYIVNCSGFNGSKFSLITYCIQLYKCKEIRNTAPVLIFFQNKNDNVAFMVFYKKNIYLCVCKL